MTLHPAPNVPPTPPLCEDRCACPDYHTWIQNHCYGCGERQDSPRDHRWCFETKPEGA